MYVFSFFGSYLHVGRVRRGKGKRETFSFGPSGLQMPVSQPGGSEKMINLSGRKNHVCFSARANNLKRLRDTSPGDTPI